MVLAPYIGRGYVDAGPATNAQFYSVIFTGKMIGAAFRRVAAQGASRASPSRSMSSNIDIATEIKELKKWKVRSSTGLSCRAWNAQSTT